VKFFAPINFDIEPRFALRTAAIETDLTDAYRVNPRRGAMAGPAGSWKSSAAFCFSQSEAPLSAEQSEELSPARKKFCLTWRVS